VDAALCYIVLSDSLIDAYHLHFQLQVLHNPTLTMQIIKSIKAFIDNVVMSAGDSDVTFPQLVKRVQQQLQWWNRLIQSSGGALNPTKCCCAFYYWKPNRHGILQLTNPDPTDSVITVAPGMSLTPIPTLELANGTQYLGIYITHNGSTKLMEDHVWKKWLPIRTPFNAHICLAMRTMCYIAHAFCQHSPTPSLQCGSPKSF